MGRVPLVLRRFTAWTLEVSFVAISALAPYHVGSVINQAYDGQPVPLNPMLSAAEETIARTLAIPVGDRHYAVAPLTNLFWSLALLAPLVVAGSQLYQLGKTGQTSPKRWLKLQVVTATGEPPGLAAVFMREGVGRWGIPLGLAYLIWRYSGAFPGLGILTSLSGLFLLGENLTVRYHRQRRGFHDRLAGTYVIDLARLPREASATYPYRPMPMRLETTQVFAEENGAVTAIILTPKSRWGGQGLWLWMRRNPGVTLMTVSLASLGLLLGTFVGTQVYVQGQANWRETRAQDDRLFIALVDKLTPPSNNPVEERRAAILTLGTIQDSRAIPLLVDLLAQENEPVLIEALQQALVTTGPDALAYLRRLNQSLRNDIESWSFGNNPQEKTTALLRRRATQRAIAKILTIYSGKLDGIELSRVDLGQAKDQPAPFTLVLDQADLGGVELRGAVLSGASLRGARFNSAGPDSRMGTYDDWIADLSGTEFKEADLTDAVLHDVPLLRTSFVRATLDRANLNGARMTGANLSSARLIKTSLQRTALENASFTGADLADADLSHANLRAARLGQASAIGANFQSANLVRSDWQGADLSKANFQNADLKEANFSETRLAGTDFRGAQLQNASFRGVNLSSVNLRGANIANADFQGAIFAPPAQADSADDFIALAPEVDPTSLLRGVNFNAAKNLDERQIRYICAQGGIHEQCAAIMPEPQPTSQAPQSAPAAPEESAE